MNFNNKKKVLNILYNYRCRNINERSVRLALTCEGNFDARVFGYMNGESDSTSK